MSRWCDLTDEQLAALPTPRLLNVFKRVRAAKSRYEVYGCEDEEEEEDFEQTNAKFAYIKSVLGQREHIE